MKTYQLEENQYLDSIFDKIPSNADIDKGKCGVGGTTLELKAERNSIIVVPNLSTIRSKKTQYNYVFVVDGNVHQKDIEHYLKDAAIDKYIKIMTTPESLQKIIKASDNIGYNVRQNFFLLLDEFHSIVTEGNYRNDISKVYEDFFQFSEKSRISATPINSIDPRFNNLKQITVKVEDKTKKVAKIIYSKDVKATLKNLLKEIERKDEQAHVFYNSVNAITQVIELIGENGVSVFCSNNPTNIEKLGKYQVLLRDTSKGDFSPTKINLYTCGHYEGWDLIDDKANIIFISDTDDEKTLLNVKIKGIQAIGRLRGNEPKEVSHIVNIVEITEDCQTQSFEEVANQVRKIADEEVTVYNYVNKLDFIPIVKRNLMKALKEMAEQIADFDKATGNATINLTKIDSEIYQILTNMLYSSKNSLENTWKEIGYDIDVKEDNFFLTEEDVKKLKNLRIGKSHKNKILIDSLHDYKLASNIAETNGTFFFSRDIENNMRENHLDLYNFYNTLGFDKIVELKYNSKLMKEEYTKRYETSGLVTGKIAKLLYTRYLLNQFYTCKEIKTYLEELYKEIGLTNTAKATDISKYFHIDTTTKSIDGSNKKGFILRYRKMSISPKSN